MHSNGDYSLPEPIEHIWGVPWRVQFGFRAVWTLNWTVYYSKICRLHTVQDVVYKFIYIFTLTRSRSPSPLHVPHPHQCACSRSHPRQHVCPCPHQNVCPHCHPKLWRRCCPHTERVSSDMLQPNATHGRAHNDVLKGVEGRATTRWRVWRVHFLLLFRRWRNPGPAYPY